MDVLTLTIGIAIQAARDQSGPEAPVQCGAFSDRLRLREVILGPLCPTSNPTYCAMSLTASVTTAQMSGTWAAVSCSTFASGSITLTKQ